MKSGLVQLSVPLSHLTPSRRNPRKVKPSREGHHRLVALIRSQGLLQPLVVRSIEGQPKQFEVVAGERRLRALREIHRGNGDPKVPCVLREVDAVTADAMSLGENFGREPMHPLDEAEAFAKLATSDGKDSKAIGAAFGSSERYIRQRMKLATLADPVKAAYREGAIDTAIAEAFAAVPQDRQLEVWKEVGGNPRHAEHVRNVIANAWIDARHALFDPSTLPPAAVSGDLFGDRILVERRAFMEAQTQVLNAKRQALTEEGWQEVIVGRREDVQDRLYAMAAPEPEYDARTTRKLAKLDQLHTKLESKFESIDSEDQRAVQTLESKIEAVQTRRQEILDAGPEHFSEETKAVATSFLILDPDGRVHCEHRLPRRGRQHSASGNGHAGADGRGEKPTPPTSHDLSDAQRAVTFAHQTIAVREALLKDPAARMRVLALILHEKCRSESLAIRHEANAITLHASSDGFKSAAFDRLADKRAKLDPFHKKHHVEDLQAYEQFANLSAAKLDALIDLLIVDCLTNHLHRPTALTEHLAKELKINVREFWRPEAAWLASFQKLQLAHLIVELMGPMHAPTPERKKSELVDLLAKLFADAAEGKLADKQLAERANRWLPSNLRTEKERATEQQVAAQETCS